MKNSLVKKILLALAAAVLVAGFSLVTLTFSSGNTDSGSHVINTLIKPVRSVVSSMVDSLEQVYNYMYKYDLLEAENEDLKKQVADLEESYREYTEVSEENERLRELLGLSERHADYKFETATIISWSDSNWSSTFTISKGSDSGLEVGDTVITETGYLVGQITQLSSASATVTTILDTRSSIGAFLYTDNGTAIAQGDYVLMKDNLLKLTYLPSDSDVVSGQTAVTSGKGGLFPRGLVIGTVTKVVPSSSGLEDYAVLEPAADFDNLSAIYIITDFEIEE